MIAPLLVRERSSLREDRLGDDQLADVLELRRAHGLVQLLHGEAECPADDDDVRPDVGQADRGAARAPFGEEGEQHVADLALDRASLTAGARLHAAQRNREQRGPRSVLGHVRLAVHGARAELLRGAGHRLAGDREIDPLLRLDGPDDREHQASDVVHAGAERAHRAHEHRGDPARELGIRLDPFVLGSLGGAQRQQLEAPRSCARLEVGAQPQAPGEPRLRIRDVEPPLVQPAADVLGEAFEGGSSHPCGHMTR